MNTEFVFNFSNFLNIVLVLFFVYMGLKMTKLVFKLMFGAVAIMSLIYLFQNVL